MSLPHHSYCLFATAIGNCGIVWQENAIIRLQLPEATLTATKTRLKSAFPALRQVSDAAIPAWTLLAIRQIQKHLQDGREDLSGIPIDVSQVPPFYQQVYQAALSIKAGQTLSYGELANRMGAPGAARAVGQALGKNPLALIVPCHRITAAGGRQGGFSAWGGLETKRRLLALEAAAEAYAQGDFSAILRSAEIYLKQIDPKLAALISRVGSCTLLPKNGSSVFAALAEAIVYQQLSGKAAATIFARFKLLFPEQDFPDPAAVLVLSDETLRSAGLSKSKALAIRDLAEKVLNRELPDMAELRAMSNEEVLTALTRVRGIGRWTAEMLLIFDLGRFNVMPATDYGVRKGFALVYGRRSLPTPEALEKFADLWQPFASVAAWYLWRALDLPTEA